MPARVEVIIIAAKNDRELLAASQIIEEMNIAVQKISDKDDLEQILKNRRDIIGVIISRQFLGDNPFTDLGRIRKLVPDIPVILAASKSSEKFEKNIRRIGVFYYMLEPYDRQEFLSVINALLDLDARNKKKKTINGSGLNASMARPDYQR